MTTTNNKKTPRGAGWEIEESLPQSNYELLAWLRESVLDLVLINALCRLGRWKVLCKVLREDDDCARWVPDVIESAARFGCIRLLKKLEDLFKWQDIHKHWFRFYAIASFRGHPEVKEWIWQYGGGKESDLIHDKMFKVHVETERASLWLVVSAKEYRERCAKEGSSAWVTERT